MFFIVPFLAFIWHLFETLFTRAKLFTSGNGKAVFITGCDTGFGNLAAKRFRALGFKVFANFYNQESVATFKKDIEKTQKSSETIQLHEVHPLVFDVTDEKAVISASEEVKKVLLSEGVPLWAIINNAGICKGTFIEFTPLTDFRAVLDVNFFAMVSVTKHFLPLIRQAKGRIVNVTSLAGVCSTPTMSSYGASKHAAEAFSDALRVEVQPFGVNVSIIEPGFMRTNILASAKKNALDLVEANPELTAQYQAKYGGTKIGTPDFHSYAGDPSVVVDAFVHAITAKHPRHRYLDFVAQNSNISSGLAG